MSNLTDREIMKASDAIDKALASATRNNRGEVALRIALVVRNLNDHIADKIWKEMRPGQQRDINKVARFFNTVSPYQFTDDSSRTKYPIKAYHKQHIIEFTEYM